MNDYLSELVKTIRPLTLEGNVASYIPELSKISPEKLGVYITDLNGNEYMAGDCEDKFTIQSISKVANYLFALEENGYENMNKIIGFLPTVRGFNSILELDIENDHRPLNPFINAGAMVILSQINGDDNGIKFERLRMFMEKIMDSKLTLNEKVYLSEKETGDKNRALAYYMKSTGIIKNDVEDLLDLYFKLCSIEVDCRDISRFAAVLANDGKSMKDGSRIIQEKNCRMTKAIMSNCGLYDASGEFAVRVGVPGKSGVGGGIMAVANKRMGIGVYGPSLDMRGNSIAGIKILELLSEKLDLSMF